MATSGDHDLAVDSQATTHAVRLTGSSRPTPCNRRICRWGLLHEQVTGWLSVP